MRIGIAHHLGWAIAVTASPEHDVVDRRRIELVEAGLPAAPVHHHGGAHPMHQSGDPLDDEALTELVARVRASAARMTALALDEIERAVEKPVVSLSLRSWPEDFPSDVPTQRRLPYESSADSVMYRQILADEAAARGWIVHRFEARTVEGEARDRLGERAGDVLDGPRSRLGPPWNKDHRMALAATVLAS